MDFANIICVFLSTLLLQSSLGQDVDNQAVSFSIKISPELQDQMVQVGTNRIYTCTSETSNTERPVLHWEINDVKVTSTTSDKRIRLESIAGDGLRLRIENSQVGDEGTYKCVGTLGVQTDSRTIRVEVYDTVKIHHSPNQFGLLGQTGIVLCNATGNPKPVITWLYENLTVIEEGEKFVPQGIQLVIKDLKFEDARVYTCDATVTKTGENDKSTINFEVIQVPVIDAEPTISPSNPKAGDEVTITCQADGVPDPTYQFKKGDSILSDDQVDKVNGILTLKDLTQEDEADYVCVASNRGGTNEKTFFLDVKIPPTIQDIPEKTEAAEGNAHQLKCLAEGDPNPTVTWKKEGHDVYEVGTTVEGLEIIEVVRDELNKAAGKILNFTSVKPQDAGAYICTAVSDVGSSSKTINLDVKYKPHFTTNFKETDFYAWEGHTANLTCLVSSNEGATFKWSKISTDGETDNIPITNAEPYLLNPVQSWPEHHLSSSSILVTVNNDDSVYGSYQCEAENSLGVTTHTVKLIQAVTPQAPVATVTNVWSTMVTLEVQAPDDNGGQPVTKYVLSYQQANDSDATEKIVDATSETTVVELRNLVSKTAYVGSIRAENVVGLGKEFPLSFDTKEVSQPLKLSVTSSRVGSEPTSYEVSWSEPDDGGSAITQFLIKYKEVTVLDKDADEWQADSSSDSQFTELVVSDANARSYSIHNLKRNMFYEIRISAVNKEGTSDEEIKVVKTSEGSSVQAGQAEDGDEEEEVEENGDKEDADDNYEKNSNVGVVEDKKNEEEGGKAGGTLSRDSKSDKSASAGLGSGTVIGIVIGLLIVIVIIAVIISLVLKKKPELVGRLRGLGGKGGEEERGKGDDGKDPAEEEKLIKKDDTVKVENEIEEGKPEQAAEEQHEEFEPDSKPEAPASPEVGAQNGTAEKPPELSTPAATTEIKITPETPEKPEDPPA